MSKLIIIEGPRNVGKTYLISKIDKPEKYKFMFSDYFTNSFIQDFNQTSLECNDKKELHYFLLGTDISFLNLIQEKVIEKDLIVDRGFISTLVFGIQAGRITYEQALNQGSYILDRYGKNFKVIYLQAAMKKDIREKDIWDFYHQNETHRLYTKLMTDLEIDFIPLFNNFDDQSVHLFNSIIQEKVSN